MHLICRSTLLLLSTRFARLGDLAAQLKMVATMALRRNIRRGGWPPLSLSFENQLVAAARRPLFKPTLVLPSPPKPHSPTGRTPSYSITSSLHTHISTSTLCHHGPEGKIAARADGKSDSEWVRARCSPC